MILEMPCHGPLLLWCSLPFQNTATMSTPTEAANKLCKRSRSLPWHQLLSMYPRPKVFHMHPSWYIEESNSLPKSLLSLLAPVFEYAPGNRFNVPSKQLSIGPLSLSPDTKICTCPFSIQYQGIQGLYCCGYEPLSDGAVHAGSNHQEEC